ncbi:hypothetical protein M427DRAFT_258656 [Gonapodya prolifera JEL478]|uniref:Uncharacterized protein n=1 Tax=Gonapodya prolifera (strain JEL478) TaxID=1344416 RepID=A0A138ZWY0_GONPJ|nr:hypothetical protein M427DRAFT_258656 [Gonapodya prolifera JEL478]|eukprot:KXS09019.1 hypothetical protein M427DRAFT_258656 [Gonapodya prolifera JEL478]
MYRILHRVRTFAKLKAGRPDASCEDTVESLELALSKWEAALPEYIKNALRSEVSPQEAEDDGVPKQEEMVFHAAHFLRLMVNLAQIFLSAFTNPWRLFYTSFVSRVFSCIDLRQLSPQMGVLRWCGPPHARRRSATVLHMKAVLL